VDAIAQLPENRRFMKGLFAWAGFRTTEVGYVRPIREAGTTKFGGWRLWNLAIEGVTSFSIVPLKVWTYIGLLVAASAFAYGFYTIVKTLVFGIDVPGYASLLTILLFTTGVQLVGLGVIGEYIGRIYFEAKARPSYLVRQITVTEALAKKN
jgi:polyisoprenyl-phosphate glycosyltransferase